MLPVGSEAVRVVGRGVEDRNASGFEGAHEGEWLGEIGFSEILGVHPKSSLARVKSIEAHGEDQVGMGLADAVDGFEHEAHPVFQGAAESAGALAGGEEMSSQRAVMAGDVDAIESRLGCGSGVFDEGVQLRLDGGVVEFSGGAWRELADENRPAP